ncbi:hypothetical protein DFH09DRAFT_152251 [Mycena vulgaris]|nr:hypothetical protein DFH09DRAFT_152251 [Mycena vulgaris]
MAVALNLEAFVSYTGPGGPNRVFRHVSGWRTFTTTFCFGLQSLTGDAILIYRCWFVWSKSWTVIMLVWLANLASDIGVLVTLTKISQGIINSREILPWAAASGP